MFTVSQIEQAHEKVTSGADFPQYIQEIKAMGVNAFETWVCDSHTDYYGKEDFHVTSAPQYEPLSISNITNEAQFRHYLQIHQQGLTDYITFCTHCAETGVEKWTVSLEEMTCTYYDKQGNKVVTEQIPGA